MRIGINTFHWSMNYGSTLQAYALCHVLRSMGHEPIVVDRHPRDQWNCLDNVAINVRTKGVIRFLSRCFLQFGDWSTFRRRQSQKRFVKRNLPLSEIPFYDWHDNAAHGLKLDMYIVGSDQVWNWEIIDVTQYLLVGAPTLPAIAYGCSFGHTAFDANARHVFKENLANFSSISVRETVGVGMLQSIGVKCVCVVDPVMLLSPDEWRGNFGCDANVCGGGREERKLLFYFINQDLLEDALDDIMTFTKSRNVSVEIYVGRYFKSRSSMDTVGSLIRRSLKLLAVKMYHRSIKFRFCADSEQFVRSIMCATDVVTDSFHGSVFSMLSGANLRIVQHGKDAYSQKSFVRLAGFAEKYIRGDAIVSSVKEALESMVSLPRINYNLTVLSQERDSSKNWLVDAIQRTIVKG